MLQRSNNKRNIFQFIQTQLNISHLLCEGGSMFSGSIKQNNFIPLDSEPNSQRELQVGSINIDEILNAIEQSNKIVIPIVKQGQVVIFQGYSGVGKSTSVLTLIGEEMIGYHHPESSVPIVISRDSKGKKKVRPEREIIAGTIEPACVQMTSHGQSIILWDMPGIGENRGLTQSLINSYYYSKIFEVQMAIKIVLTINHNDIAFDQKGSNLEKVLTDFTKMFGDVDPFHKSLSLMITKSPRFFTIEKALDSFKKIKQNLNFIKSNKNIFSLVDKFSSGAIPILIFYQPYLGENLVNDSNPLVVGQQYKQFHQNFYKTVKSLKSSKQIKLNGPAMSSAEKQKCQVFVTKTKSKIQQNTTFLFNNLVKFLTKDEFLNYELKKENAIAKIDSIAKIKEFTTKFEALTKLNNAETKKQLKQKFSQLNDLILKFQINNLFNIGYNLIECPPMEKIRDGFIMVNFLNTLEFHQQEKYKWLQEIEMYKYLFNKLYSINAQNLWNTIEITLNQKIEALTVELFKEHVNGWQNSEIYNLWKNHYKFFPSFGLRISKFMKSNKSEKQFFDKYFKEISQVEDSVMLSSKQVTDINTILNHRKAKLNTTLSPSIIEKDMIPYVQKKCKELCQKGTAKIQNWPQKDVNLSILQYNHLCQMFNDEVKANQAQKPPPGYKFKYSEDIHLYALQKAIKSSYIALNVKEKRIEQQIIDRSLKKQQQLNDKFQKKQKDLSARAQKQEKQMNDKLQKRQKQMSTKLQKQQIQQKGKLQQQQKMFNDDIARRKKDFENYCKQKQQFCKKLSLDQQQKFKEFQKMKQAQEQLKNLRRYKLCGWFHCCLPLC